MEKLFAKSAPEWTTLQDHTSHVAMAVVRFANHLGLDADAAYKGAVLHDIGKAHPAFQALLQGKTGKKVFRHEIASLFFLSLFEKEIHSQLIEMVVGHHKSVKNDAGGKGLLDLIQNDDIENHHLGDWDNWSLSALELLSTFGVETRPLSKNDALANFETVVNYCRASVKTRGHSVWRGLLMGADHYASALIDSTEKTLANAFISPKLDFFDRKSEQYPLSLKPADSEKPHSMVVACTGAGKTDYLFRRCRGRVFYTLPFQASINAMYKRLARDLEDDNPNLDIRVLHASSSLVKRGKEDEETVLQPLFGSSIKVLTPHQIAAIAFAIKGYEAILLDLKGCDVILDEIHTYTGVSQAIVLKIVEVLVGLGCRVHIGTATMPTVLYNRVKDILGAENVLETQLLPEELDTYDRHITHKLDNWEKGLEIIDNALIEQINPKILIVCNRVDAAQKLYQQIEAKYIGVDTLLLHSRFKRGDRNAKEKQLIGLDENGAPLNTFNTSNKACIVVSTQIVEVSLDISFDLMITECAPLDALVQRFGRINRKRTGQRTLKPVYVIAPPEAKNEALPYDLDKLRITYEILPDGQVLRERGLQAMIDKVFPTIDFLDIEEHAKFKSDGSITIDMLTHRPKSYLLELLDIDSVTCITQADREDYINGYYEDRMNMEIPARYYHVKDMEQLEGKGNQPYVIPDTSYDPELGLQVHKIKTQNLDVNYQLM